MNYKLRINDLFYKYSAQILTASFLKLKQNDIIVEYRIKN